MYDKLFVLLKPIHGPAVAQWRRVTIDSVNTRRHMCSRVQSTGLATGVANSIAQL